MRPKLSILLGSGFSRPAGINGVQQLNERLRQINEDEIMIHSSEIAMFLNGQKDNNRWMNADGRLYVQDFLTFYRENVLKDGEIFDYETFYDFYSAYFHNQGNKEAIEGFHNDFVAKYPKMHVRDCLNALADFNRTFNQLIASLLFKADYWDDGTTSNFPPYDAFVGFLLKAVNTYDVKVHTLNHDMLLEWLGYHHSNLFSIFSDGFQLEGSPYYGELNRGFQIANGGSIHKTYMVKLERFVDKFDTPISLFKLHGSIQHRTVYTQGTQPKVERVKTNYGVEKYFYENRENTKSDKFDWVLENVSPDVLSGTTNKILYYTADPYFANLFKHFENNLEGSELLVAIGYGFRDEEVNRYLADCFLKKGKRMVVVNRSAPTAEFLKSYEYSLHEASVTDLSFDQWLNILK